ncbi:MAG TPA: tRNA (adenosine(37)-N6)-threonylcarbamoyltransferase complex transferase subunit TsaD [Acidimicrobiales bacterium]|nr:tRNA (adenosine(37)-N6)-threonylcarbamoyltransferase complex transferase subunit TsaD [Acidimicrobiales bacterium]
MSAAPRQVADRDRSPGDEPSRLGRPSGGSPAEHLRLLAIETSCDETAAAVVDDGREVVSSVVSSQVDLHAHYGGVVPEIASRAHVELIVPIVAEALAAAGLDSRGRPPAPVRRAATASIGAVAATVGPGLVGCLLVGVSLAKALAMAWGVPFVGVNHLEGHLYASLLETPQLELPVVVLLVSGGHTLLVEMNAPGSYHVLGRTKDDAAGEAFDKVARYLGLGYPGGPAIDRIARHGDASAVQFPRALLEGSADFSFSGVKTAVVTYVEAHPEVRSEDVAASFQEAVVDVLVEKTFRAASAVGARGVCLAGGVAANSLLRERASAAGEQAGLPVYLPSRAMCTDNAAMIGAAGYFRLRGHGPSGWGTGAEPGLGIGS